MLAVESFKDERQFVDEFILHEIQQRGVQDIRKDSTSGVKNLLWMKRALDFIISFLELLMLGDPESSSKVCATKAYDKVLEDYHGNHHVCVRAGCNTFTLCWLVSNMVTMSFNVRRGKNCSRNWGSLTKSIHMIKPRPLWHASGRNTELITIQLNAHISNIFLFVLNTLFVFIIFVLIILFVLII
eukprot:GHVS01061511.1.p1 GENE.GHVS01061511.1~~GHVS01061511.1.p1  ORF type:complete len:185 (-),score=6.70 GHVS01061511.1:125-679(-)